MTADYTRILAEVQRSEQESKNLIKLINDYQDYARRINILGAEIDRLKVENKALDDDVKKMRLKYAEGINEEKREEALNMRLFLMAIEVQTLRERLDQKSQTHEEMRKSILEPIRKI
jgi:predicted RNase H-like nuclease (RuvC/YqgF family)